MRATLAAACAVALLPAAALAQTLPRYAVVTVPEVTLRAGPSDKYPDTGTLPKGTRVVVHEEAAGGWLGVQAPGSISWVPTQFIDFNKEKPIPQVVATQAEVAPAPGKIGLAQPLAESRLQTLPPGTLLTVIGTSVKFDNKTWYPVEPVLGDYRYVPVTAVQFEQAVNTDFVVRDTPPPAAEAPHSPQTPSPAAPASTSPAVNHPLWSQAAAAEREGRFEEAEKLYFQLARVMNEPGGDHDIANLCYTRIHLIREKKRGGGQPGARSTSGSGNRDVVPVSAGARRTPSDGDNRATLLPPVADDRNGSRTDEKSAAPPTPPAEPDDGGPRWTGPGVLLVAPVQLNGRETYVLESAPGTAARVYAVGAPGVDLRPYWKRKVDLYGTVHNHPNVKKPYIIVTKVEPNP